jgi:hypothetical protein
VDIFHFSIFSLYIKKKNDLKCEIIINSTQCSSLLITEGNAISCIWEESLKKCVKEEKKNEEMNVDSDVIIWIVIGIISMIMIILFIVIIIIFKKKNNKKIENE